MLIASVLLPLPLDKTFDYQLNEDANIGQRVRVEFGRSRQLIGIITSLREADNSPADCAALKPVLAVLEDFTVVDAAWWALIRFAARYYAEPLGKAFKNALPSRLRTDASLQIPRQTWLKLTVHGQKLFASGKLEKTAPRQQRLLSRLSQQGEVPSATLAMLRQHGISKADTDRALKNNCVSIAYRSPYNDQQPVQAPAYALNQQQQQTVAAIQDKGEQFAVHLIDGVTGSGKTEVYIRLIEQAIARQQQVLLLVPEIGLTPQMLARFTVRFGRRVAAYHSGLGDALRRDIFLSALHADLPILIGTRSAIFVPMPRLGLILIDEEHDLSYKQHEGFLYHARDLAVFRGKQANIPVVMGSATPSLESLANAERGIFHLHRLSERATGATLPEIIIVDRRGHGREQVLAKQVQQQMRQTLQRGEQVLLFLNRRGFSPVMCCSNCDWHSDCPACSVYQTAHLQTRQLCCHHCGHIEPIPLRCPNCGEAALYFPGAGTEKLESQLNKQFPNYRVLRLDRDKQSTAGQLDTALAKIHAGEVDIIVGTQLLAKGHHFKNVTLVCVVDADSALFSSDFRAEERLYQQLIQVAGRAGRETLPGQVYIQSSVPEHAVFHALLRHDYGAYAKQLLRQRADYQLPPFVAIALIKASAKQQATVLDYLRALKSALSTHATALTTLGPVPLAIARINNRYQAQLWLSAADKATLQKALPLVQQMIAHYDPGNRYQTVIDVDAISP